MSPPLELVRLRDESFEPHPHPPAIAGAEMLFVAVPQVVFRSEKIRIAGDAQALRFSTMGHSIVFTDPSTFVAADERVRVVSLEGAPTTTEPGVPIRVVVKAGRGGGPIAIAMTGVEISPFYRPFYRPGPERQPPKPEEQSHAIIGLAGAVLESCDRYELPRLSAMCASMAVDRPTRIRAISIRTDAPGLVDLVDLKVGANSQLRAPGNLPLALLGGRIAFDCELAEPGIRIAAKFLNRDPNAAHWAEIDLYCEIGEALSRPPAPPEHGHRHGHSHARHHPQLYPEER
jgi:hypothetical protein